MTSSLVVFFTITFPGTHSRHLVAQLRYICSWMPHHHRCMVLMSNHSVSSGACSQVKIACCKPSSDGTVVYYARETEHAVTYYPV